MGLMVSLLSMWVIVDSPVDMPDRYVARLHEVTANGAVATKQVLTGATLEAVRKQLPRGVRKVPPELRHPLDDPNIVEVWL